MADFAQTRSEYLKIMMGERKDALAPYRPEQLNDLGDTSFDVASLSDDDINNAITKMTGTQYEGTDVFNSLQTEQEKRNKNKEGDKPWWEATLDFFSNIGTSITEGVLNVVDDVWDFTIGVVGGIGGGWFGQQNEFTDWVANAMTDDRWVDYTTKALTQIDVFDTGFWTNSGGYWTDWSYENIARQQERDYEGMDWLRKGGNFIGYIIPSLVLAYFTGGSSIGVQAAAQGGLALASAYGRSTSQALSEGASFQEASGYGAIKGAISGAISAATVGLGASALGQGGGIGGKVGDAIGAKVAEATGSRAAEVFASKASEALVHAGFSAANGFAQVMADPVIKQITYDSDAIAEAYGDNEKVKQTLMRAGYAAMSSAAMSLAQTTIREVGSYAYRGSDGYMAKFYSQKAIRAQSRLETKIRSLNRDIQAGKDVNIEARMREIDTITSQVEKYGQQSLQYFEALQATAEANQERSVVVDENGVVVQGKQSLDYGHNTDLVRNFGNLVQRKTITDLILNGRSGARTGSPNPAVPQLTYHQDGSGEAQVGSALVSYPKASESVFFSDRTNPNLPSVEARVINGKVTLTPQTFGELQTIVSLAQDKQAMASLPEVLQLPLKTGGIRLDISVLNPNQISKLVFLENGDFKVTKSGAMVADLGEGRSFALSADKTGGEIIETSKTDSWVKPSEEVPAISTGASEAPKPEPVKPLDLAAEPSVVKEAANAKAGKVYSLASAKGAVKIVENTIKELLELDDIDGGHTKFHIAKGSSAKALFDNLNLGTKEQQLAVKESLRTKLLDTKVKYTLSSDFYTGDGEEYTSTVRELLSLLDDEDLKKFDEDFNRAWDELVESGDESRLTKVIEAYENKLEKWVTKAKDLSVKKKFSNILSRNRTKIRDRVTGDYDYEKIEERDLHTINMLAKPLDSLKRSYGTYRADKDTLDAFLTAQKYYVEENYTEDSSIDFSEDVKAALDAVVDLIKGDVNNPEISAETYAALVKYQKAVLDYERELKRVEITERKPAAYAASAELAHYDPSVVQKIFSPIIDNFGGISGEILTKFGYGEITKKFVVEPIKAYGKKMDFTYKSWDEVGQYLPKRGFHSKQKVGELNGVKVTRGELIFAYMSTHLAPVNAENINTGGIGFRSKNGAIKWAFDGDIDAIKTAIADLISDEDVKIATDLFNEIINGTWHKQYIDFERDVKHKVDVETVDQYLPMYKENDFQASIDKMVSGDPIFRYSIKRTGDKRGLIMVDIVDVLSDYIDRLGTMMYQLPANKAANALLNSKTESGKRLATEIKDKYGSKTLRMLRDVNNAFVKKSAQETQNIVTKVLGVLTHGYTVAKLSDPIRPIKNYFSYITSNMDFAGMPRATVSRFNKDVMDDVKWLIENKIFTMKYRARSGDVLKGNTQTVVGGIQAKVDKVLMAEVTAVDWFAMDSGLVQIVAEARHRGIDVRSNEGADLVESIWTIFYLSNVGSTPLHKSRLSNNVLTKYVFDILAGAKRAQVASFAMQGSLFHQFKGITEDEVNEAVRRAEALVRSAEEETNRATEAEERSIDELHEAREERDRLIKEKASEEDIARARETVKQKKEDAQRAKSEREAAEEEEAKAHSQEREAKNQQEGFRQFKFAGGKRIPINIIGKMILVGVLTTGVSMLTKFLYGKKNFDEYNAKEIITDAALNSFVNWVPVLDTLVGGIMNGHEIDPPSVSTLNNLISTFSEIIDSFQDGKITGGLINSLITMIEGITGLPLSTVKKYVYGIMKMISPASAYKFNTLFFNMSATGLSSAAKDFAEKNDISSSADLLQTLYQTYKTGDISREVAVEQAKLIAEGFNPIARNIPEYIQDDKGEKATLSEDQKTKFSKAYAYANEQVSKLVKSVKYKEFDAETKAKTIKKIYDIYYEVAKYQSLGVDPDSRIGKLLAYCGGDYDIAQTLFLIQQNAELMDNRRFTKKEQAVRLVNKQQMSRPQKLLTLYLMGYGVSSENKKIVQNYLISLGFTKKQASEFLP